MDYIAESKNIKISSRKVRLVVDQIKKLDLLSAVSYLQVLNKRSAMPVKKTIESAIANAVNNFKADKNNLTINDIQVNDAGAYKRYHYAARGRIRPYKKRTSHIKVILEEKTEKKTAVTKEKGGSV